MTAVSTSAFPFLPPHVVAAVLRGNQDGFEALEGAFLYADISGFTELSERLAVTGDEGAEILTDAVSRCFSRYLAIIGEHGGSVLKFGGDALLVYFPSEPRAAAERAAVCGRRLIESTRALPPLGVEGSRVKLRLKVALHSGSIVGFIADLGVGQLEYVIAGRDLECLARCEAAASSGELLATPAFAKALALSGVRKGFVRLSLRRCRLTGSERSEWYPPIPASKRAALKRLNSRFLPPTVAERLAYLREGSAWLFERRRVTALFLNVAGWEDSADDAAAGRSSTRYRDSMTRYLRRVNRILRTYGGVFSRVDLCDKGLKILGFFGAPVGRERDEEGALNAALALLDAGKEVRLRLRSRIGIQTGDVFCGMVGAATRREYTIMGDAVNTAARCMAAARWGRILAGAETINAARPLFDTTSRRIKAKGKREPVAAFEVRGHRRGSSGAKVQMAMVGRWKERRLIDGRLGSGEGFLIRIAGEAGIGKTTLMDYAESRWAGRGGASVRVESRRHEVERPFSTLSRLVASCLDWPEEISPRGLRSRINRLRGAERSVVGALFGIEAKGRRRRPDPELRRRVVTEILARKRNGLFLLEDIHWMDPHSRQVLDVLFRKERGLKVIVTTRPEGRTVFRPSHDVALEPFSYEDTVLLARRMLGKGRLSEDQCREIHQRAQGNPFFLTELLAAVRDTGGFGRLPGSINAVMMARLDRFSEEYRLILRAAAVIGMDFDCRRVREILPVRVSLKRLAGILDYLATHQFLMRLSSFHFRFRHALTQQAVYDSVPRRQARDLHRWLAERMEARRHPDLFFLAYHFDKAGIPEKAARYHLALAEEADRVFANERAIEHYKRAAYWASAVPRGGEPGRAGILMKLAEVWKRLGRYDEAVRSYAEAERVSRRRRDWLGAARARDSIGICRQREGRHEEARHHSLRALRLLKRLPGRDDAARSDTLAKCYNSLTVAYWYLGKYREAIRYGELSLAERRKAGDPRNIARGLFSLGNSYLKVCAFEDALRCFSELDSTSRQANDRAGLAYALDGRAGCAKLTGDLAGAVKLHRRAAMIRKKIGDRRGLVYAYLGIAAAYLTLGFAERAAPFLEKANEYLEQTTELNLVSDILRNRAYAEFLRNRLVAAQLYIERALRAAEYTGFLEARIRSLYVQADILAVLGRREPALKICRRLARMAESSGMAEIVVGTERILGDIYHRGGDTTRARIHWLRAEEMARERILLTDLLLITARLERTETPVPRAASASAGAG
ncbi:MAG: NACHT domain-containing protein, partial [Candidatus Hydrogenedentota bacterium]